MQSNRNQMWQFIKENNKIEGIDLSERDFIVAINGLAKADNSYHVHATNSIQACDYVIENYKTELGIGDIMCLHELQMGGQLKDEELGIIRTVKVGIKKTSINTETIIMSMYDQLPDSSMFKTEIIQLTPPKQINIRLKGFIKLFNSKKSANNLGSHYEFECIHPFIDGNGRVGRLLWLWRELKFGSSKFLLLDEFEGSDFYDRRKQYYDAIQEYRDNKF